MQEQYTPWPLKQGAIIWRNAKLHRIDNLLSANGETIAWATCEGQLVEFPWTAEESQRCISDGLAQLEIQRLWQARGYQQIRNQIYGTQEEQAFARQHGIDAALSAEQRRCLWAALPLKLRLKISRMKQESAWQQNEAGREPRKAVSSPVFAAV